MTFGEESSAALYSTQYRLGFDGKVSLPRGSGCSRISLGFYGVHSLAIAFYPDGIEAFLNKN